MKKTITGRHQSLRPGGTELPNPPGRKVNPSDLFATSSAGKKSTIEKLSALLQVHFEEFSLSAKKRRVRLESGFSIDDFDVTAVIELGPTGSNAISTIHYSPRVLPFRQYNTFLQHTAGGYDVTVELINITIERSGPSSGNRQDPLAIGTMLVGTVRGIDEFARSESDKSLGESFAGKDIFERILKFREGIVVAGLFELTGMLSAVFSDDILSTHEDYIVLGEDQRSLLTYRFGPVTVSAQSAAADFRLTPQQRK